jgi:CRP-like cAMP-binding protein
MDPNIPHGPAASRSTFASLDVRRTAPRDGVAGQPGADAVEIRSSEPNQLLAALPPAEYDRLMRELAVERLDAGRTLLAPEARIERAYFIRSGVISILSRDESGEAVEVGTVGREGFLGLPLLLGNERSSHELVVSVAGEALTLSGQAFRRLTQELPGFRTLLLRFANYFITQLAQLVSCNRMHTVEQRCARWLAMAHDPTQGDGMVMTHERLATLLGVRRAGVSVAMGVLQSAGIVQYSRGRIVIRDHERLAAASCGCSKMVRRAYRHLLDPERSTAERTVG